MNKCIERLYNGIIKENPTFVLMLRYVSDPGNHHHRHQRYRYGTVDHGGSDFL